MRPLYDRTGTLAGWEDDGGSLFDTRLAWVAFATGGNLFSADGLVWLGPRRGMTILDRTGRPVLWSPGEVVGSALHPRPPMTPKRPMRPKMPMRPVQPLPPQAPRPPACGWSALLLAEWLVQGAAPPPGGEDEEAPEADT